MVIMGTEHSVFPGAPGIVAITMREGQICAAASAAEAAFQHLADVAGDKCETGDELQKQVFDLFRWYFMTGFCTRLLSETAHRLDEQSLQVSMDILSAVKMAMSAVEVEQAMAMVDREITTPTQARANAIGNRGHLIGWTAAGFYKAGQACPKDVRTSLKSALSIPLYRV